MTRVDRSSRDAAASHPAGGAASPWRLPEETGVLVALIVMIAVIGFAKPRFLNPINLFTVLGNTTFQGMLALGMVYFAGNPRDRLVCRLDVQLLRRRRGVADGRRSRSLAGDALRRGPFSVRSSRLGETGSSLSRLRLPTIIVTLGTFLDVSRGCRWLPTTAARSTRPTPTTSYFTLVSASFSACLPVVAIAVFHASPFVLSRPCCIETRFGYRVQAVGSNPEAAMLAGHPQLAWCGCRRWF